MRCQLFGVLIAACGLAGPQLLIPTAWADDTSDAAALVDQLGDDDFVVRERAAETLKKLGLKAEAALEAGTERIDREVRFRSQRILNYIRSEEFSRMLDAFLSDAGSNRDYALPGWERFRQRLGDSKASRGLFVEMQRTEPGLLEVLSEGGKRAASLLDERMSQVQYMTRFGQQPRLGSVACMLLLASDEKIPVGGNSFNVIYSLLHQPAFRDAMSGGAKRPMLRSMLGRWVLRAEGTYAYQSLMLAMQYGLKEGLQAADNALASTAVPSHVKNYAVMTYAKLGQKSDIPKLMRLFEDKTPCTTRQVNRVTYQTQIRDIAVAACIHLSGKSLRDFGFQTDVNPQSQFVFNASMLGFESEQKRQATFDKWEAFYRTVRPPALQPPLENAP